MKILVITDHFPPDVEGGYELRCEEACNWLHNKNYEIRVLTIENDKINDNHKYHVKRKLKKYADGSTPKNWNIIIRYFNAVRDNYIFRKEVNNFKPDYLYLWRCQGISRSLIPELFNSQIQTKVDMCDTWLKKVSTEHGPIYGFLQRETESKWKGYLKYIVLKSLPFLSLGYLRKNYSMDVKSTDGVFCSSYVKQFHLESFIECEHFEVVNTGVNQKLFFYKEKIIDDCDILSLLYVGALTKEKGIFFLLELLRNIKEYTNKKIILNMVGKFSNKDEKQQFLRLLETPLANVDINIEGFVNRNKLYHYYHNAHFTIIPTLWDEPFSRVPLESMACGTPCIATVTTGLNDLIKVKAPLLLLKKEDERSLGKVLSPFSDLKENYSKLCLNSNNFIQENYTFNHYMDKISNKFFSI